MKRYFVAIAVAGLLIAVTTLTAKAETPAEAVGFFGTVTGDIKLRAEDGTSFVITVSKAVADEKNSKVKNTAPMVGKDLTLGTRMPRDKDGNPHPHVDDVAYIKTLKAGDKINVQVFAVRSDPTLLRMSKPGESVSK